MNIKVSINSLGKMVGKHSIIFIISEKRSEEKEMINVIKYEK